MGIVIVNKHPVDYVMLKQPFSVVFRLLGYCKSNQTLLYFFKLIFVKIGF